MFSHGFEVFLVGSSQPTTKDNLRCITANNQGLAAFPNIAEVSPHKTSVGDEKPVRNERKLCAYWIFFVRQHTSAARWCIQCCGGNCLPYSIF